MKNKRILIIGGTGALGKTLIKKYHQDNTIMIFSRDEHKHVDLLKEYPNIKSHLGDIRDKDSITNSFSRFKPQVVINTAALKHVPICEENAMESVKTNILGHQNLIEVTSKAWVGKIVGFVCAAGGNNSYMAPVSMMNSLMLHNRCLIIPRFVYASSEDFLNDNSFNDDIKERLEQLVNEAIKLKGVYK